tara:strand:+ start:72 stop:557 length:486 start_codon:yes stop_codon:yes gene_type:complete
MLSLVLLTKYMIQINMNFPRLLRILSAPLIFSVILFNINPKLGEVKASNKIIPADEKDLELYRSMGITYICTASMKGSDLDFEKSLVVASNLFSTVVQQKHGGFIKEGKKKEQKLDPKLLQNSVMFQLVGGALNYCPDNVPKGMEKEFENQVKRIEKLNKK